MQFKFGLTIAVLLAFIAEGHSQLQCYVCDNCAKIDKNTPLQACDADTATTTTMTTPMVSTTTHMSSTEESSSTSETTTTTTGPPTPATVGPVSSTTGLPTPPNVGTLLPVDVQVVTIPTDHTSSINNSTSNLTLTTEPTLFVTPSVVTTTTDLPITVLPTASNVTSNLTSEHPSTLLVRQRRNIPVNGMTYHCYKVQKKYDNVYGVQRGCMGVLTAQSVCAELKAANNNQTHKCQPCSTSKCNGSSTIGVSIATLLVALVAVIYKY